MWLWRNGWKSHSRGHRLGTSCKPGWTPIRCTVHGAALYGGKRSVRYRMPSRWTYSPMQKAVVACVCGKLKVTPRSGCVPLNGVSPSCSGDGNESRVLTGRCSDRRQTAAHHPMDVGIEAVRSGQYGPAPNPFIRLSAPVCGPLIWAGLALQRHRRSELSPYRYREHPECPEWPQNLHLSTPP